MKNDALSRAGPQPDCVILAGLAAICVPCRATANQFRLLIHTAAYWLLLSLRDLALRTSFWRYAQFDTIRYGSFEISIAWIKLMLSSGGTPTNMSSPSR